MGNRSEPQSASLWKFVRGKQAIDCWLVSYVFEGYLFKYPEAVPIIKWVLKLDSNELLKYFNIIVRTATTALCEQQEDKALKHSSKEDNALC